MIRYIYTFDEDNQVAFEVDETGFTSLEEGQDLDAEWLRLDRFRCKQCTLPPDSRRTCPAAVAMRQVVQTFSQRFSYDKVHVEVELHQVQLVATVSTQDALRSLLGLQLALCECPVLRKLRPMAHYHVPFGREEHTVFRFLAMYLIAQYLRKESDLTPDWDLTGLDKLFDDLHEVNKELADRIRAASEKDATVNSLVLLDAFADIVAMSLEDHFPRLREVFSIYLQDGGAR